MKGLLSLSSCLWLSLTLSVALHSQSLTVIDHEGKVLSGATAICNQSMTISDANGVIKILELNCDTLLLQYVGCEEKKISRSSIDTHQTISLNCEANTLGQVMILGRNASEFTQYIQQYEYIDDREITVSGAQTAADILELNSAVFVQKSQMGGGSPVLRGFEANKVLLVVDGVRLNNAIYRNGHLQNAITIDPAILSGVEVLFGSNSLLYGSDALGGVVHYKTQDPTWGSSPQVKLTQLNSSLRHSTANDEKRIHLDFSLGNNRISHLISASYADYGDLRSGSNRLDSYPMFGDRPFYVSRINSIDSILINPNSDIQVGTAYKQYDLMLKSKWKLSDKVIPSLILQYSNSGDIPRYDNLTEIRDGLPRYAEWFYGPQKRLLVSPQLDYQIGNAWMDRIKIITAYQYISEQRNSRRYRSNSLTQRDETVQVLNLQTDISKTFNPKSQLEYGLGIDHNAVDSKAHSQNTNDFTQESTLTRYPNDRSYLTQLGLYMRHLWTPREDWLIATGIRYSYQNVALNYLRDLTIEWPDHFYDGINNKSDALVWNASMSYNPNQWTFKFSSGTSFRAPNIDDLAKIRVNNDEITVPNPDLKPERLWSNALSINYTAPSIAIDISTYYNNIDALISRANFHLPDGSERFAVENEELLVTANVNQESARIIGLSLGGRWDLNELWQINSSVSLQRGRITTGENSPLAHIPPTFGSSSLRYQHNNLLFKLLYRFNAWKRIKDYGGSVDNPDLATIDGSPAWHLLSIQAEYQIKEEWRLNFSINNLMDRHYRPFASGVSAAGRHISIGLHYKYLNNG